MKSKQRGEEGCGRKDNFVVAPKSLEKSEQMLRVKEAQLLEALSRHRSLEEQASILRETRLACADLPLCLDS